MAIPPSVSGARAESRLALYWRLVRLHRPIGILLLLWPTLWALWIANDGMPAGYTLETLPKPDDARITLRKIAPARFAVLRFSGYATSGSVETRTAELLAWVKGRHLRTVGPVSLAQYDPPWTLWFLRRNEVMLQLEE